MSKRKLLLADDSVTIQKVVNLTFADEGIEVISVGDGDSAMAKIAEITPDLIMADVNMPGLSGYQICEKIRADESLRHTPVILLVGSFEPFDEDEAKRVGADDYLTKPFQSIRQLVNKVTLLLSSNREDVSVFSPTVTESSHYLETLEIEKQKTGFSPIETDSYQIDADSYQSLSSAEQFSTPNPTPIFALDDVQKLELRSETPVQTDLLKTQPLTTEEREDFNLAEENQSPTESEYAVRNAQELAQDNFENSAVIDYPTIETPTYFNEPVRDEFLAVNDEFKPEEEPLAPTTDFAEEENLIAQEEDMPLPEAAAVLQLDDDDPLELPPIEFDFDDDDDDEEIEEQEIEAEEDLEETPQEIDLHKNTVETPIERPLEYQNQSPAVFETIAPVSTEPVNFASNQSSVASSQESFVANISPELIDAIVQKVLERLSDKVIREVAWEVVPSMSELIIKKMAEEKLRQ